MANPVRYPNGVTTVGATDALAAFPLPDPSGVHTYWNDFDVYTAADWTETAVSVGTGTSASTIADADGGIIALVTAANENDGAWYEAQGESFLIETGKKAWIKVRFSVTDATQSDIVFGLASTSTAPQGADYRFLFESVDGSAAIYFNVDDNTTDSDSSTVATLADSTYVVLAAYYDGAGTIKLYADGVHITTMSDVDVPGVELAVSWGMINGSASAETLSVDYLLVAKER